MEKSAINEVSITKVAVKKEDLGDDIKEFAKSAMNEFLGWYGYENPRDDSAVVLGRSCRSNSASNDSEVESLKFTEGCGWCGKSVDESKGLSSATAVFCSELCFSQSRRANFKRNKTCDWCKHVRHTVSYVDFQDGASQLQFCSDKCLNQYKMHIFCRETRAHLELHPHLLESEPTSGTLITPDLWFRNCKSPPDRIEPAISPGTSSNLTALPLISVAHPSKLMSNEMKRNRTVKCKKTRKRYSSTVTSGVLPNDAPQDLRVRHTPPPPPLDVLEESSSKSLSAEVTSESLKLKTFTGATSNVSTESSTTQLKVEPLLGSLLPPQTVFVPYPVILPLPIPIPIPIPIPKMLKVNNKNLTELKDNFSQTETVVTETDKTKKCVRKRKRLADQTKKVFVRNKKKITTRN